MPRLQAYLPPVLALAATLLGVLGENLSSGRGLDSISLSGWGALAIAGIGAWLAVVNIRKAQREHEKMLLVASGALLQPFGRLSDVLELAAMLPAVAADGGMRMPGEKVDHALAERKGLEVLGSAPVVSRLQQQYLSSSLAMADYFDQSVPFGTDRRRILKLMSEETGAAREELKKGLYGFGATTLGTDLWSAGQAVLGQPFLDFLERLPEKWSLRSEMEDTTNPRSMRFTFLDSGNPGGFTQDYQNLVAALLDLQRRLTKAGR